MIGITVNKHLWGWWAGILFAFIQLGDSLVRLLSLGFLTTNWVAAFVQHQGRLAIIKKASR